MFQYELPRYLPTADELPCSDDTPVDNELQELIPGLLKSILQILWVDRMDWFFGIDMGIYYHPEQPPIVPDGFLSLGVERFYDEELRPSYVLWEEQVVPSFVLEVVSGTPGREYTSKLDEYARMGVLYYVIYNSKRRRKPKLEIHKLVNDKYELQDSNPFWMPEIGLGIGYERGDYGGLTRDWLYWYNEHNRRYPTPAEQIRQAQAQVVQERAQVVQVQAQVTQERAQVLQAQAQLAQERAQVLQAQAQVAQERDRVLQAQVQVAQERDRSNKLAAKLRELGIDPDNI
ncbi:Uma2 family endonuclease [Chamaesiphon sp. OTE_20_metabat_361]|uniref:Uma2 family endonuclease n=1 Tax=Chamaesiphon sp. OTE_20_metabat_361 TaxID=2964689 RepID=UPI00286A3CE7|nr:Uma2 family endonuclease [Chamaesiphon sp. OTE_20_metabat_361]